MLAAELSDYRCVAQAMWSAPEPRQLAPVQCRVPGGNNGGKVDRSSGVVLVGYVMLVGWGNRAATPFQGPIKVENAATLPAAGDA